MGKGLCFPLSFLTLWGLMWLNGACFGVRFQRLLLPHPTPRSGGGGDHSYLWAPRMNQVHLEAPPPAPGRPQPSCQALVTAGGSGVHSLGPRSRWLQFCACRTPAP